MRRPCSALALRAPQSHPDAVPHPLSPTSEAPLNASTFLDLHRTWAWVVIISNGIVGAWALAANWLTVLRVKALWWATAVAQLTVFVQVTFGVILVNRYGFELPQFHAFYGFVGIIAVAIIYAYRIQMRHRLYLLYGLGSLFVMGLAIRALLIGHLR